MSKPIRVFHLIKSLGRGGAEMLLPEGLRCADREGFDYAYGYFLPHKDAMVPALQQQGVEVVCFPARNNVSICLRAKKVAAYLKKWQADVIHCHLPIAGVIGRMAGRAAGVPVIYTEHNKMERYHAFTRKLNTTTWDWQDRVVAVSEDVASSIATHVRSNVPVDVVLNGVNLDHFNPAAVCGSCIRRDLGIPEEAPVIGTVAVFRTQKRLTDWLAAADAIRKARPDTHFLLIGDGPLREQVEATIRDLSLEKVVHLPGLQEDVRPYLAAMNLYMMSSQFEGLPVALLEAMAMQRAVVVTAVGGIPEAVHDNQNGILVPPADPQTLASACLLLLGDPSLRHRLGQEARRTVDEQFSMTRMQRDLEGIYHELVRRPARAH